MAQPSVFTTAPAGRGGTLVGRIEHAVIVVIEINTS